MRSDQPAAAAVPRWLRFVLASDRAGSAWYVGTGFLLRAGARRAVAVAGGHRRALGGHWADRAVAGATRHRDGRWAGADLAVRRRDPRGLLAEPWSTTDPTRVVSKSATIGDSGGRQSQRRRRRGQGHRDQRRRKGFGHRRKRQPTSSVATSRAVSAASSRIPSTSRPTPWTEPRKSLPAESTT